MPYIFEIHKSAENGRYFFLFKNTDDGTAYARSGQYPQKKSVERGIAAIRKNCQQRNRYEELIHNDKYFFKIKSGNGQVVAVSKDFDTKAERQDAIYLMNDYAVEAPTVIVDLDADGAERG